MLRALRAEVLKLKRSTTPLWTFAIVLFAPIMVSGAASSMGGPLRWEQFMRMGVALFAGWYGTLIFSLAAAYMFGREYSEGTTKEMLTLPVRREHVLVAKAVVLIAWLLALTVISVAAQGVVAALLGMKGASWSVAAECLWNTMKVAALLFATLPIVVLLAIRGRGYLAPMAFSAVATTIGLGVAEAGWTRWFPWSMQIAVAGMALFPAGPVQTLVSASWALMASLFAVGAAAVVWQVDRADNTQ